MIAPEQAPGRSQQEPGHGPEASQAERQVQDPGQAAVEPPGSPQQIVGQAQHQAPEDGQEEFPALVRDRKLHQPNSREKNPPASLALSS